MKKRSSNPGRQAKAGKTSKAPRPAKRPTNLTLDPEAVARGERYTQRHGGSLSHLVTRLLYALPDEQPAIVSESLPPAVGRLYGVAKGANDGREDRRAHLLEKYGRDR